MTDFSKKSGDFGSLSATDIKVLALTYMLEANTVGIDHLKETPTIQRTTEFYNPKVNVKQPVSYTHLTLPTIYSV